MAGEEAKASTDTAAPSNAIMTKIPAVVTLKINLGNAANGPRAPAPPLHWLFGPWSPNPWRRFAQVALLVAAIAALAAWLLWVDRLSP